MGKFTSQPQTERVDERRKMLLRPFIYELDADVASWAHVGEIVVPAGFISDGASIPRPLWWLIGSPFTGKYERGAYIHDYLYCVQMTTRGLADRIFFRANMDEGVGTLKRNSIHLGLEAGGGFAWRNNARERLKDEEAFCINHGLVGYSFYGGVQRQRDPEDGGARRDVRSGDRELIDGP